MRAEPSAVAAVDEALRRVAETDDELRAFTELDAAGARAAARASDERRAAGALLGPLDGVPVAVKANVAVAGLVWSAGIRARRERTATADAPVTAALRAAGAVVLGTLNMAEGAIGATTENPWTGSCRNPRDPTRTSGGSSGGSGAAVGAGLCAIALGTDTLGSVRVPAAYCGVVGLKPTAGLVSDRGVVPLSRFLDTVGPLAADVDGVAAAMAAIAVHDPGWAWSRRAPRALDWSLAGASLDGVRVGVPARLCGVVCEPGVQRAFDAACATLAAAGADVVEVALPLAAPATRRAGFVLAEAGAYAFHRELLEHDPDGFSETFRGFVRFGGELPGWRLSTYLERLEEARAAVLEALHAVDALALPTTPQVAFPAELPPPDDQADLTAPANVAGLPAVSVPCGTGEGGLPVGLQLVGRAFHDDDLLRLAAAYAAARDAGVSPR